MTTDKQNSKISPEFQEKAPQQRASTAQDLLARGFYLFPLRRNGKLPAHKGWRAEATLDLRTVERWIAKGFNLGIDTDKSRLVVLDCDVKHAGVNGIDNFIQLAGGIEPDTFTVATASGGRHFVFRGDPVKSTASALAPGVDVKSRGGYVVAPGSVIDGKPYVIVNAAPIQPVPQWLVDTIARAYTTAAPVAKLTSAVELDTDAALDEAHRYLAEAPASIEGQGGDANAYKIACRLKDIGLSTEITLDFMDCMAGWNDRSVPPFDRTDLERIVYSAYRNGQNSPGSASAAADFDIITDWNPDGPANDNPAPVNGNRISDAGRTLARATLDLSKLAGTQPPPRDWLVQDWVPVDVVTLFYGDGGTGKSLAALQLAVAVATGELWFGLPVKAGRALYVTAEDDAHELHRRLADITNGQGFGLVDLVGKIDVVSLAAEDPTLAQTGKRDMLEFTPLWKALATRIANWKPRLVVLDTLADVFAGNENIRAQARAFIGELRKTGIEHKTNIFVLAHPSRDGLKVQGNNAAAGSSGSTAWHNSVRSRLVLERDDKTGLRTLHVAKANYGGVGAEIRLRWSAGAFAVEGGAASVAEANAEAERVFLSLLDCYTAEGRRVGPNPGKNYAPSVFADDDRAGIFDSQALTLAMNRLFAAGVIRVEEHGPASKRRDFIARVAELDAAA